MKKKAQKTISSILIIINLLLVGCGPVQSAATPTSLSNPGEKNLSPSSEEI